ncbi:MAG: hypothetical protein AB7Q97_17810 [Gammaproteobacteria bacterium]
MSHDYSYRSVLAASERIHWRVEDLINDQRTLDFSRPFMPESLARTGALGFLDADARRVLNQIRGHGYLYIFGLVEEFILPFVLDHARPQLGGDDHRVRALLGFADEEAKHIHLFRMFRAEFLRGFGTPCEVIGPAAEIARAVLAHRPLAVALVILQIEWMTQRHFRDSVRDDQELDPQFKSLLRHHWMEEAQHARLDTLLVESLAANATSAEIDRSIEDYWKIGALIDGGLQQQTQLDLEALERATGILPHAQERDEFMRVQLQANRFTFLGSGMTHPRFLDTLGTVSPKARRMVENAVATFQ